MPAKYHILLSKAYIQMRSNDIEYQPSLRALGLRGVRRMSIFNAAGMGTNIRIPLLDPFALFRTQVQKFVYVSWPEDATVANLTAPATEG
jgi:hypothetical protein